MSDFKREMISVFIGAAIGFGTALGLQFISDHREQSKSYLLLKTEISVVESALRRAEDIVMFNTESILLLDIPQLELSAQESRLTHMDDAIASEVYQLNCDLKSAESLRLSAAPISEQTDSPAYKMFSDKLYKAIESAQQHIATIKSKI